MQNAKLDIQNLSFVYHTDKREIPVLNNISMHLQSQEFVSIVGPSGCGKSTLLHIIAGIENPLSGGIKIDGKTNEKRLGTSGYMFQKPLLLPWKTVRENIMLGLLIKHFSKQHANEQAHMLLQRFGLIDFAEMYPATLSGGMAQRVALLRTILYQKEFLLMDEPFGALDALTRLTLQSWLLSVWQEFQSSVLFITHDIREALLLSDRIYVLSHRPAKVIKELHVPIPRPRHRKELNGKIALALEKELEKLLLV